MRYYRDVAMLGDGKVIYANKTIHAWLHKQAMNAKNVNRPSTSTAVIRFLPGIPNPSCGCNPQLICRNGVRRRSLLDNCFVLRSSGHYGHRCFN
jgi:hypothetical protein